MGCACPICMSRRSPQDAPLPDMPGTHLVTRTPGGRLLCVFPPGGMHFTRAVVTVGPKPLPALGGVGVDPAPDAWEEQRFTDHSWEFEDLKAAMDAVLDWDGEPDSLNGWLRHHGGGVTTRS